MYQDKHFNASVVFKEAGWVVSRFQNTEYGIEAVSGSIQNDIYETKKYIKAIQDEAEFNICSLKGVIDSLQNYLASKAIFMPEGSYYEEFASASVGGSSVTKTSTSSVEGANSNNTGAEVGKKIVSGVKTAIGVATAAIASFVPSPEDAPQQQYIGATPKTEIARSIDHYNNGNSKQERLNQDYLELEERRKKEESEVIPNANVPAGAGGDVPKSDVLYRFIENEDGIPIGIEVNTNEPSGVLYEGTSGENIEENTDNYENSETYQECLKFAGIDGDYITQSKMVSALKEVVENTDLAMRVTPEVLSKILSDGKFKNFFETGTTRGTKDTEGRIKSSNYLFGTNKEIKAEGFEKFGYLEAKGTPQAHEYYPLSQQYGGVIIKFKRGRVKASFTCGDSLGFYQNQTNGGVACPITNPALCSMNKFQMKNLCDAVKNNRVPRSVGELSYLLSSGNQANYFEVQYHGDLRVEDIESVTFISNYVMPNTEVIAKLNDLKIKYDICNL